MKLNKTQIKQIELTYKDIKSRLLMSLLGIFMMTFIVIAIYFFNDVEPVGFLENLGLIITILFSTISFVVGLGFICTSFSQYGWNDVKEEKNE